MPLSYDFQGLPIVTLGFPLFSDLHGHAWITHSLTRKQPNLYSDIAVLTFL